MAFAIDPALQALSAFGLSMQVRANNIANVNTPGYKSREAVLETGPDGRGVGVAAVVQDDSPGALVPQLENVETEDGRTETREVYVQSSNTDLAREMVGMMLDQHAFSANAATVRTWEQAGGSIIDMLA